MPRLHGKALPFALRGHNSSSARHDTAGSLGRYRATREQPPALNRMGGSAWDHAKARARKAIAKVA